MIAENLFDKVLLEPVKEGADKIYIVSGYATAAMAHHHFDTIKKTIKKQIHINLIVGMCPYDGLSLSNHRAFQQFMSDEYLNYFECSYVYKRPAVHSKTYSWFQGDTPICGFIGSANYTQNAFGKNQRELFTHCDPQAGFEYFQSLTADSIFCTHGDIENYIEVYRDTYYSRRQKGQLEEQGLRFVATEDSDLRDLPAVRVSLLDNNGEMPGRSGLNWGQRPEESREPNQAYIRLPSTVYRTEFFPPVAVHFTILTDDEKILICTRAQQNGKAIHTPHNNSLIGEYFRNRLGLQNGAFVTKDDLLRYGRTDVDFYKIDDETYFMDFSVPVRNG